MSITNDTGMVVISLFYTLRRIKFDPVCDEVGISYETAVVPKRSGSSEMARWRMFCAEFNARLKLSTSTLRTRIVVSTD